jgi:osmotically-inducible protein OsmY
MARKWLIIPAAAVFGALVEFFVDPRQGRRRRAVMRDRSAATFRKVTRRTGQRARYMEGHLAGAMHAVRPDRARRDYDDLTLKHKIESEVFRNYDDAKLNVNVDEGVAVLRGELRRPDEIRRLEHDVSRVAGVRSVRSLVHTPA